MNLNYTYWLYLKSNSVEICMVYNRLIKYDQSKYDKV